MLLPLLALLPLTTGSILSVPGANYAYLSTNAQQEGKGDGLIVPQRDRQVRSSRQDSAATAGPGLISPADTASVGALPTPPTD